AVCARLPLFGQPWLELECRPIDANEPSLREQVEKVGRLIRGHHPVERAGARSDGANDLPAPFWRSGSLTHLTRRRTSAHEEEGGQQSGRDSQTHITRRCLESRGNRAGLRGPVSVVDQSWPPRPTSWPAKDCADSKTFVRGFFNVIARSLLRAKKPS